MAKRRINKWSFFISIHLGLFPKSLFYPPRNSLKIPPLFSLLTTPPPPLMLSLQKYRCVFILHLFFHKSIFLSYTYLYNLPVYLSIYLSFYLSIYLSIFLIHLYPFFPHPLRLISIRLTSPLTQLAPLSVNPAESRLTTYNLYSHSHPNSNQHPPPP